MSRQLIWKTLMRKDIHNGYSGILIVRDMYLGKVIVCEWFVAPL